MFISFTSLRNWENVPQNKDGDKPPEVSLVIHDCHSLNKNGRKIALSFEHVRNLCDVAATNCAKIAAGLHALIWSCNFSATKIELREKNSLCKPVFRIVAKNWWKKKLVISWNVQRGDVGEQWIPLLGFGCYFGSSRSLWCCIYSLPATPTSCIFVERRKERWEVNSTIKRLSESDGREQKAPALTRSSYSCAVNPIILPPPPPPLHPLSVRAKKRHWLFSSVVGRQTAEWEVTGSNPDRTTNQGLMKITGKIILAVIKTCLSTDDRVILVHIARWR